MKMSSRYSPQLVCSSSAASGSYDRVRASSRAQGAGVGGASEELEEAVVPDFFFFEFRGEAGSVAGGVGDARLIGKGKRK
jgi:hypothetical protein